MINNKKYKKESKPAISHKLTIAQVPERNSTLLFASICRPLTSDLHL